MRILDDKTGRVLDHVSLYLTRAELVRLGQIATYVDEEDLVPGWHAHLDGDQDEKGVFLGVYEPEWDAGERWNQLFREDRWEHGPITNH